MSRYQMIFVGVGLAVLTTLSALAPSLRAQAQFAPIQLQQRLANTAARRDKIKELVAQGKSLPEIKKELGEAVAPPAGGGGPGFPTFYRRRL